MHFPDDFKKRLKEVLPENYHYDIEVGNYSIVGVQLLQGNKLSISPETIIAAFEEGREKEDILGLAKKAVKMKILNQELNMLWKKQFVE